MLGRAWVGLGSLALAFAAATAHAQSLTTASPQPAATPIPWDNSLNIPTLPATAVTPGAPIWLKPSLGDQIFDVSYTAGWPAALRLRNRGYGVDVTPHTTLGLTSAGESAEAGATLRFGGADALDELGHRGAPGHWYFYAQSSGRAVGYNLNKGEPNFRSANLFTQTEPGFMGDAEAGVAWRRGDLQAAFGYTERSLQLDNLRDTNVNTRESVVGFTFSFRPGRR